MLQINKSKSKMTELEMTYEYNPCIRKGKYRHTYKKPKKYEPKAHKWNLNQSRRHKIIESEIDAFHDTKDSLTELIEILNTENVLKWNSNYEQVYKEYNLEEIEELKNGYLTIQYKICEDMWEKYCENTDVYFEELY